MDIHEYQAKELFARSGIPILKGEVARSADEAEAIARRVGGPVVVKAQVHTGGRGKAGGVKYSKTPSEARENAEKILGMRIKDHVVQVVLVVEAADIAAEAYVGITHDRAARKAVVMVSSEGGIDIEEVAATNPDAILKEAIEPALGLTAGQARRLGFHLYGHDPMLAKTAAALLSKLADTFFENDCTLAEINPLIVTEGGELIALDAKISIDDNGLVRHKEIEQLRDLAAEDAADTKARDAGLAFHKLEGEVGCVVNGAGLAMSTLDAIEHFGGKAANFLDIGGSSNPEKVLTAMEIILRDPNVRVILFNIFGGITRCDDVARGLVQVFKSTEIGVPVVIRLTGTNEEEAREILGEVDVVTEPTMDGVIQRAIELGRG
ncbi:MAG: ADP-forming succinate--CoA ligase subunit beta [Gemmatimonadetes bacterium]|nr:ADP-forming succinate--CoA ligase subunit beta [Gemmatimonadota bacterium]